MGSVYYYLFSPELSGHDYFNTVFFYALQFVIVWNGIQVVLLWSKDPFVNFANNFSVYNIFIIFYEYAILYPLLNL